MGVAVAGRGGRGKRGSTVTWGWGGRVGLASMGWAAVQFRRWCGWGRAGCLRRPRGHARRGDRVGALTTCPVGLEKRRRDMLSSTAIGWAAACALTQMSRKNLGGSCVIFRHPQLIQPVCLQTIPGTRFVRDEYINGDWWTHESFVHASKYRRRYRRCARWHGPRSTRKKKRVDIHRGRPSDTHTTGGSTSRMRHTRLKSRLGVNGKQTTNEKQKQDLHPATTQKKAHNQEPQIASNGTGTSAYTTIAQPEAHKQPSTTSPKPQLPPITNHQPSPPVTI